MMFMICLSVTSTSFAIEKVANSDAILTDMYANPGKYIRYGGASTGLSFFIDKSSINVHKYNPPEYIIAAQVITHFNAVLREGIIKATTYRYRYDYVARRMYREVADGNGAVQWQLVDPSASKSYHDDNWVALGEIMFCLAYNMSFYDRPIVAKQFINDGLSVLPLVNLPNGGDRTVWHCYNHKTKQIEWWKYVKNQRTNKEEFLRIK